MKIVFISLPSPFADEPAMNPPLGMCYISAYLKSKGYTDISLIDFNLYKNYDYMNEKKYLDEIPLDAGVYGIYCITPQFKWFKEIAQYLKDNIESTIISGGPHSTNCPEDCLKYCDIAVIGDGEKTMFKIIDGVALNNLDGIAFIENGKLINNGKSSIKNLDQFPNMDLDLINFNLYKRKIDNKKAAHIITLRGCPYNCAFCDKYSVGHNVRYRNIENIEKEIDDFKLKYNINSFVIYDDIFTLDKIRAKKICNLFRDRNSKWRAWVRSDLVNESILSYMQKSGLQSITLGIESGDDNVLRRIKKRTTRYRNIEALKLLKKLGIPVRCSLMFGNPGETKESLQNTIDMIRECDVDEWNLAVLSPIPGSEIYNIPEIYGINFDKIWLKQNDYLPCNRFGDSGVGNPWVTIDTMTEPMIDNLKWFVNELEKAAPRKQIQDTIQNIKIGKI